MAAIGFAGELALAGAFWFSHLAMALFTRKYRKKNPKRVIANNQPELPVSGQILVIGIDGELTAVPNDMAVVCSDYGGGGYCLPDFWRIGYHGTGWIRRKQFFEK